MKRQSGHLVTLVKNCFHFFLHYLSRPAKQLALKNSQRPSWICQRSEESPSIGSRSPGARKPLNNVSGQLFLMDRFLDGTFFTFGIEVISFAMRDEEDRVDPVIYIFPRMTKCSFHKFGSSGNIESHDALCILPINIVNEKIYIFIWFWFLILGVLTTLVVFYRLVIIFSPRMRAYLLYIRFRLIRKECINIIIKKAQIGDWFLLYMLGQNVDSMIFKEVVHELSRRLGYQAKDLIDF